MEIFRLVFNPIDVNTYILADASGDCAIIDCGCYDMEEFNILIDLIDEKRLKPVLLLNTHCHLDHIFGDRFMLEKYSTRAFCHKDDLYNRKKATGHALMFGLAMENPPEPAGFLTDGQKISFGQTGLAAIHVPGHAAGSLAFYSDIDKSVFTGDALFAGSIGRTDLPGGNYETLINSITKKLFTLPAETIVYPGHGESTTIENEVRSNPYFIHN
ncbi:MAG TPA: MBL fold hydrolase [Bacteroidales bacterium]|nr:MBL fold hydrolase [Bacteroidales bacterium]HBZ20965.1 MBL fold hydrolase [Bacteroidales bacterium]